MICFGRRVAGGGGGGHRYGCLGVRQACTTLMVDLFYIGMILFWGRKRAINKMKKSLIIIINFYP